MSYFPTTLIAYVSGLAAMRLTAADEAWTAAQTIWMNGGAALLVILLIATILQTGLRSTYRNFGAAALATLMIVVGVAHSQHTDIAHSIARAMDHSIPTAAVASPVGTADVKRHWDGHFRAQADVNGEMIEMLVDTGASLVLLTYADAYAAGIDMDQLNFNVPILTANGRSHVATLTLEHINIGGVVVKNVEAAVAERGQLHASLLGMSFLGEIEEAVIRKDRMILKN